MAITYGDSTSQTIKGTAGADELYGGAGNDLILPHVLPTATGDGTSGSPYVYVPSVASGDDVVEGGTGNDALYGGDGSDALYGGEGDESGAVDAGGGSYHKAGLFGGDGDDTIYGGGGDDDLYGGLGQDDLYGGNDTDTFIFGSLEEIGKGSTSDYIGDFRSKQGDLIDLSAIDANDIKGGDQKFKWIGDDSFSKPGQISFKNGKVKINTDNDKGAEAMLIVNTNKMAADDFIL